MPKLASANPIPVEVWRLVQSIAISAFYDFLAVKKFAVSFVKVHDIKTVVTECSFVFSFNFSEGEKEYVAEVTYWSSGILHNLYRLWNEPYSGDYVTVLIVSGKQNSDDQRELGSISGLSESPLTSTRILLSSGAQLIEEIPLRNELVVKVLRSLSPKLSVV